MVTNRNKKNSFQSQVNQLMTAGLAMGGQLLAGEFGSQLGRFLGSALDYSSFRGR